MNKNCYLHLGLHKTASSSFQRSCFVNKDLLKSFDVTYPIFSCSVANEKSVINHSIPIYSLFCKKPSNYHINIRWKVCNQIDEVNDSYLKQLEFFLESSKNIILSGEGISLLDKDDLGNFVKKIKSYDFKVHIISLIRSPYISTVPTVRKKLKVEIIEI